ncbi:30S ribosomal protein S20 [Candidatus Anaplasma sp. TIGMIC]|uniref:30S ribosomal protein S20 n=1 Tax=Candidatus Anaplasma sp. TIGMIC TaxID=3020713 RepID=UPI00232CD7D5|nr:30S ribosomal protein S20 [Candidatus Anaplasma sp. TIGMIC]MDB1135460.1 30S ribosomal protein S20 [Candidatus Anaplasma sp. TIGMIC]
MPNHSSAKKMVRVIERRTRSNRVRKSRVRNSVKAFLAALDNNSPIEDAVAAFRKAESNIHKCVNKGIFHRNTAARKVKALAGRLKAFDLARLQQG